MAVDAKTGQPIYSGVPGVGLSNVGSYQSSGTPWITASLLSADQNSGSLARFDFPRVAKNSSQSYSNCLRRRHLHGNIRSSAYLLGNP